MLIDTILEVPQAFPFALVQEAYRLRSWELHPDVSLLPDAHDRFLELTQSFSNFRKATRPDSKTPYDWDDPDCLSSALYSGVPDRIKSGMIRRIGTLDPFGQMAVLLDCLKHGSPTLVWSATHVLARIECRSAFAIFCDRFSSMPRAVKLAMIRFKHTVGGQQAFQIERLAQIDSDVIISGNWRVKTL